jgi:cobalt/nickel transport protein
VTQVVRADANGVFTFGIPAAGWWGFAGLNTAQERIQHDGTSKEVEVGAVLWVEALAWPEP